MEGEENNLLIESTVLNMTSIIQENYLDERKEMTFGGKEAEFTSKSFEAFTEKCFTPCASVTSKTNAADIASQKANEILQFTNSRDVIVSLCWLNVIHNPSSCNSRRLFLESI